MPRPATGRAGVVDAWGTLDRILGSTVVSVDPDDAGPLQTWPRPLKAL